MGITKIRKQQASDPDFAFQAELDVTRDNQTSLWVASTMNNKALLDGIKSTRDNGDGSSFVGSIMSNKALYDRMQAQGNAEVYGAFYEMQKDDSETSTTGTVFVDKISWTTGPLSPGTYEIKWYCQMRTANGATGEVQTDVAGTAQPSCVFVNSSSSLNLPIVGFRVLYVTTGTAGTKVLKLQFKSQTSGKVVYVSYAIMSIIKILDTTS